MSVMAKSSFCLGGSWAKRASMEFSNLIGSAVRAALAALLLLVAVTPAMAESGCFEGCYSSLEASAESSEVVSADIESSIPIDDRQDSPSQPAHCAFGHNVQNLGIPTSPVLTVEHRASAGTHILKLASRPTGFEPEGQERPPQA